MYVLVVLLILSVVLFLAALAVDYLVVIFGLARLPHNITGLSRTASGRRFSSKDGTSMSAPSAKMVTHCHKTALSASKIEKKEKLLSKKGMIFFNG